MNSTDLCPLCGGPNACGAAAGASTCWCFTATIPPETLDRLPEDQRNRACICQACAAASGPETAAAPEGPTGQRPTTDRRP